MTIRIISWRLASLGVATAAVAFLAILATGTGSDARQSAGQKQPAARLAAAASRTQLAAASAPALVSPSVEDLHRKTTQPAQVESYEQTDMYAKASGFLKSVLVDLGDSVEKDQLLAELWIPEMTQELQHKDAQVEQAQAAVEQAQARMTTTESLVEAAQAMVAETKASIAAQEAEVSFRRSEHDRMTELVQSRSINAALLDEKLQHLRAAQAALAMATAKVKSVEAQVAVEQARQREAGANVAFAKSQLKVAEASRDQTAVLAKYAEIRAPYAGLITRRWMDSGDFVASAAETKSTPLYTLERIDRLRIVFDVPESESGLVAIGQAASLKVDALKNRVFTGRVQRTAGVLDPKTRTLRVEVELDAPTSDLRPGMYGMITVTVANVAQAMLVPVHSVRYEDQLTVVYCQTNGVADRRVVELGYVDGSRVQVTKGLGPQDQVLVDFVSVSILNP